jgi:hypothetical protein
VPISWQENGKSPLSQMNGRNFFKDLSDFGLMSRPQALRYFDGNAAGLSRVLRAHSSFVSVSTELIRHRRNDREPIAVLKPGDVLPTPGHIAHLARARWAPAAPEVIIRGSATLSALYGGHSHPIASLHVSHHIAIVEVLQGKLSDPHFQWTFSKVSPGCPVPDAISTSGFIEIIGNYGTGRISAKLALAASASIQLW